MWTSGSEMENQGAMFEIEALSSVIIYLIMLMYDMGTMIKLLERPFFDQTTKR